MRAIKITEETPQSMQTSPETSSGEAGAELRILEERLSADLAQFKSEVKTFLRWAAVINVVIAVAVIATVASVSYETANWSLDAANQVQERADRIDRRVDAIEASTDEVSADAKRIADSVATLTAAVTDQSD